MKKIKKLRKNKIYHTSKDKKMKTENVKMKYGKFEFKSTNPSWNTFIITILLLVFLVVFFFFESVLVSFIVWLIDY